MTTKSRWFIGIIFTVIIALSIFFYIRYFFVFGEGVQSGQLNFIVYKGYLFKTYEGRMIQAGIKGDSKNAIQSNEFNFSIVNPKLAKELELMSGKEVDLHYKEYLATLPWRGESEYVVDSIIPTHKIK